MTRSVVHEVTKRRLFCRISYSSAPHLPYCRWYTRSSQLFELRRWRIPLEDQIRKHRERLAQAEHLGWDAERFANGWTYAPSRNDPQKQHNLLVDWVHLSDTDKQKDRDNMDAIPTWLQLAGYRAVLVLTED